jgi:hypothetical protein
MRELRLASWLGIASVFFLNSNASAASAPSAPSTEEVVQLTAKANQILPRIKKMSDQLQLTWLGPTSFIPEYKMIDQDFQDQVRITGDAIELESKACDFSFHREDGRFSDYQNKKISDAMQGPGGVLFRSADKPTWTEAKAIQIASSFLRIFTGPLVVKLGAPQADYISQSVGPNRSYQGYWRICWPRVDDEGHLFFGDDVSIQIPEGGSPLGGAVFLSTPYNEVTGRVIAKDKAEFEARRAVAAQSFLGSSELFSANDRIIANKLISSEMAVVLPAKDIRIMGGPSTGVARLAWILWFKPQHSKKPEHSIYNDSFAIWVDAHNGKIIGRDGYL